MSIRERLNRLTKLNSLIDGKVKQYDKARKSSTIEFYSGQGKVLANELNAQIDRLCDEKLAAMQLIDGTPELTANEITVLYMHFLEGKSYEAIAQEIYYTKTTVFRTCTKAVEKVCKHWENT